MKHAYGSLYGCRHGAYSAVVAAGSFAEARLTFHSFLIERGENINAEALASPRVTKTLGDRLLLIASQD